MPILLVGELRDNEVVIVSQKSGKKSGYKLPCCEAEIQEFYDSFTLNVVPMLSRIGIMNDYFVSHSEGTLNFIKNAKMEDNPYKRKYERLNKLVDIARDTF